MGGPDTGLRSTPPHAEDMRRKGRAPTRITPKTGEQPLRSRTPIAVALAALMAMLAVPAQAAASCQGGPDPDVVATVVSDLNRLRAAEGLAPVTVAPALTAAAARQACDMARQGRLSHGRSVMQRVRSSGYSPTVAAENIAAGQTDASGALRMWRQSRAHNANLMDRRVRQIGLGSATATDGRTSYWSLILAAPR